MKKGKIKALLVLLVIVLAGIYYYVTIPAINIHSTGIWIFMIGYFIISNKLIHDKWTCADCMCLAPFFAVVIICLFR